MRAPECPIRKSSRRLNRRSLANEDTLLKRFFSIFASSSPRLEIYSKVGNLQIALFLLRGNFRKSKQTLTRVNILNKSSVEAFNDVQICGTANESSFLDQFWVWGSCLELQVHFRPLHYILHFVFPIHDLLSRFLMYQFRKLSSVRSFFFSLSVMCLVWRTHFSALSLVHSVQCTQFSALSLSIIFQGHDS